MMDIVQLAIDKAQEQLDQKNYNPAWLVRDKAALEVTRAAYLQFLYLRDNGQHDQTQSESDLGDALEAWAKTVLTIEPKLYS